MNSMITTGHAPSSMIDPNDKTDYAKMKRLVNLDRLDGNRKGIVQRIAEKGYIDANIVPSFPAYEMVKPDMFVSLLYYYGREFQLISPLYSFPTVKYRIIFRDSCSRKSIRVIYA